MKLIHEKVSVYISCPGWRCIPIIRAWNVLAYNSVPHNWPQLRTSGVVSSLEHERTKQVRKARRAKRPPSYSPTTTLLGGTWCPSAPSGRGLRHSLIQRSQSPLSEQISGVSHSPDYLNNAKGSSCTCNMADSEWFDELSWYKRPVPLECFELRSCTQFWILILVAAGVWLQTKACFQTGKLFVIGTWGQWPRKMQVTAVHSNIFGGKNEIDFLNK